MSKARVLSARAALLDAVGIFCLTAALIWPLFRIEYLDAWSSIESTFIADARFLKTNWPHPQWQPNWYCGTRFDYIYPPALRYGTAALSLLFDVSTSRSYHLYTAFHYCLGIAGVYLLAAAGLRSRPWAWLAAAASTLVSPSFLLLPHFRLDYGVVRWMPVRLGVLVRYGEGPHSSAYAILALALAAAWFGLRKGNRAWVGLSALASALVVSNNFYGATALAILFPILVWAVWVESQDGGVWLRAAAITGLACGLTAFWLTPSYVKLTIRNLKLVAQPGNWWSVWLAIGAAVAFGALSWRLGRSKPGSAWPVFVFGGLALIGLNVLGVAYFGFRVSGEPERLVPELDMVIILAAVTALAALWRRPSRSFKAVAAMVVVAGLLPSRGFVRRAWDFLPADYQPERRIEWRTSEWMHRNLPGARALATGSVRFWYNAWHDLPQLGGGSEQGVMNLNTSAAYYQITAGDSAEVAVIWAQALGVDALIVHDGTSEELYHDYEKPHRFRGALEVLHQDGAGNWIYRVPRRFPGVARVVEAERIRELQAARMDIDYEALRRYVAAVEQGPESPPDWSRQGPEQMTVSVRLRTGEAVLLQETWDPAWKAYSEGRPLPVERDPLDFMLIAAGEGEHEIVMQFETPLEKQVGRAISLLSLLVVATTLVRVRRPG